MPRMTIAVLSRFPLSRSRVRNSTPCKQAVTRRAPLSTPSPLPIPSPEKSPCPHLLNSVIRIPRKIAALSVKLHSLCSQNACPQLRLIRHCQTGSPLPVNHLLGLRAKHALGFTRAASTFGCRPVHPPADRFLQRPPADGASFAPTPSGVNSRETNTSTHPACPTLFATPQTRRKTRSCENLCHFPRSSAPQPPLLRSPPKNPLTRSILVLTFSAGCVY